RTVVISAVANVVRADGLALTAAGHADVIVMRADRDVLTFQFRIAAFPNAHDVLSHDARWSRRDGDSHVLIGAEIERSHRIRSRRATHDRGRVKFLALQ